MPRRAGVPAAEAEYHQPAGNGYQELFVDGQIGPLSIERDAVDANAAALGLRNQLAESDRLARVYTEAANLSRVAGEVCCWV